MEMLRTPVVKSDDVKPERRRVLEGYKAGFGSQGVDLPKADEVNTAMHAGV